MIIEIVIDLIYDILYVVSPYLVFVAFLVRLKDIHRFQIDQKGYFKEKSICMVENDQFGHIVKPTRTFPVGRILSFLQLF